MNTETENPSGYSIKLPASQSLKVRERPRPDVYERLGRLKGAIATGADIGSSQANVQS